MMLGCQNQSSDTSNLRILFLLKIADKNCVEADEARLSLKIYDALNQSSDTSNLRIDIRVFPGVKALVKLCLAEHPHDELVVI